MKQPEQSDDALLLAVDAGGTKTDYVLADSLSTLARVRGGSIVRLRVDAATAALHLQQALTALQQQTGRDLHRVARTCIGTAGETVPLVVDWLRGAFQAHVGGDLLVLGDVEIALDAAFPDGGGVLALAGTGSNVAGRVAGGIVSTVGGYGPMLANQGSGTRIGQEALRAAFLAQDERRATLLLEEVRRFWNLPTSDAIIAYANSAPVPDFSQLTPLVLRCADAGDAVANEVLHAQGIELAYLVRLMMRRLRALSADPAWTPPLAFAGSIMETVAPVWETLIADVQREFPEIRLVSGVVDPIAGALRRARN